MNVVSLMCACGHCAMPIELKLRREPAPWGRGTTMRLPSVVTCTCLVCRATNEVKVLETHAGVHATVTRVYA